MSTTSTSYAGADGGGGGGGGGGGWLACSQGEDGAGGSSGGGPPAFAAARYKVLHDPVHKYMTLTDEVLAVVDTPQFQRLRELKQLGTVYYVYPGAAHNRFEHSLGVAWLSGLMVDHLAAAQPALRVTDAERVAVRVAGAVHDLGHGPLSHVFDGLFIPLACPGVAWRHEDMSLRLLDLLIDDNAIDCLDEGGALDMVKKMVVGVKAGGAASAAAASLAPAREERPFLYEIVANGVSGIDTDKFDYILRDTHNVGMTTAFDYRRLLFGSRVMADGHIGFHVKEAGTAYELFHTRHQLFRQIYVHRATKAVEYMITDVLLEADAAWGRRLSSAIHDPRAYARLTDNVIHEIEHVERDNPALRAAHDILRNLRRRRLYRFVDEHLVPAALEATMPAISPADIAAHNPHPSTRLDHRDIIVHDAVFNYGKGRSNPVDAVTFFRDAADDTGMRMRRDKVSHMLPTVFQERIIRVYSKNSDEAVVAAVQAAFRRCLRTFNPRAGMAPDPASRVFTSQAAPDPALLAASPDSLVLGELDEPPRAAGADGGDAAAAAAADEAPPPRLQPTAATPLRAASATADAAARAHARGTGSRMASPATAAIHGHPGGGFLSGASSPRGGSTPSRAHSGAVDPAAAAARREAMAEHLSNNLGAARRALPHPPAHAHTRAHAAGTLDELPLGDDDDGAAAAAAAAATLLPAPIARPPRPPTSAAKRALPPAADVAQAAAEPAAKRTAPR